MGITVWSAGGGNGPEANLYALEEATKARAGGQALNAS